MTARLQHSRTAIINNPPADNVLLPGELFVEMASPQRLWVGVPVSVDPSGKILLVERGSADVDVGVGLAGEAVGLTYVLSHGDTSAVANTTNGGFQFIQNLTFDSFGHVLSVQTAEAPLPTGDFAPSEHEHVAADITDLIAVLSGYASLNHTHTVSQIPDLATVVATKADLAGASFSGQVSSPLLVARKQTSDATQGGRVELEKPSTGSTLNGPVQIRFKDNLLQIMETASPFRGVFVNLANMANAVGSRILTSTDSPIPPGAVMLFRQGTAPTGWTRVVDPSLDDCALRVVTSSTYGAAVTGTYKMSELFVADWETDGHALTVAELALHGHPFAVSADGDIDATGAFMMDTTSVTVHNAHTGSASSANGHQIGGTGGGAAHSHGLDLALKYIDLIIATKD